MSVFLAREKGQYFFFIFLCICSLAVAYFLPRLAIPLCVAYVLYLLILPIVLWLERLGFSRTQGTALLFLSLTALLIYPIMIAIPFVNSEFVVLQDFLPRAQDVVGAKYEILRQAIYGRTGFDMGDRFIQDSLVSLSAYFKSVALRLPSFLASFLEWLFVTPLFLFFFLTGGRDFKFMIMRLVPNSIFERTYHLFYQFNKQLGDYIMAKIVEALIVGVMITLGLWIAGVNFAFLLGVLAGVTNIIPYVGPVLGMVPALLFVLAEYGTGSTFVAAVLIYSIANAIDIAIVFPVLVSKIVDLHPVVVIISVILGSQFFGVMGMVISIPIAAAVKLLFIEIYQEFYSLDSK